MTQPVRVLKGDIVFYTRRVVGRSYFLRPDPEIKHLLRYCLAYGAQTYGIQPIGAVAMSNHWHLLFVDVEARRPDFLRWVNGHIARAVNERRERSGRFWDLPRPSDVLLLDGPKTVLDKLCYLLVNPVKAGAVQTAAEWPGLWTKPRACALPPERVARPPFFFRAGRLPESVELQMYVPPTHAHLSKAAFGDLVAAEVASREAAIRAARAEAGQPFQGPDACRQIDWRHQAQSPDARGPGSSPPGIIGDDPESSELLQDALRAFRKAYAEARHVWLNGDRAVSWPEGTWAMVETHACLAHPPP